MDEDTTIALINTIDLLTSCLGDLHEEMKKLSFNSNRIANSLERIDSHLISIERSYLDK